MMKSKMPKLDKPVKPKPKTKKGPVIEAKPPPGALPPLPEVHFTEDEIGFDRGEYSVRDLEGMDLSDAKLEKEPFWHSVLFIAWVLVVIVAVGVGIILYEMTPPGVLR